MPGNKTSGKKPTAWTKPTSWTMPTAKKKSTAKKIGVKGAVVMARHPVARKATVRAARPTAKVGWRVGKVVAKRKAREKADQIESTARTAAALWVIYGVPLARELGLIERPKPRRTGRVFVAGLAIGAAAVYFVEPEHGAEHRANVAKLLGSSG
jgi:hypothetical protein